MGTCSHSCLISFLHPSLEIGICTAYFLTSFVHNCRFLLCHFYSFPSPSRETSSLIILHRNPLPFLLILIYRSCEEPKVQRFLGMQLRLLQPHGAHAFLTIDNSCNADSLWNINDFQILANFHILSRTSFVR